MERGNQSPNPENPELDKHFIGMQTEVEQLLERLESKGALNHSAHRFLYPLLPDHPYIIPDSVLGLAPHLTHLEVGIRESRETESAAPTFALSFDFHSPEFSIESLERISDDGHVKVDTWMTFHENAIMNGIFYEKSEPVGLTALQRADHEILLESLVDELESFHPHALPSRLKETATYHEYHLRHDCETPEASIHATLYNGLLGQYAYRCAGRKKSEIITIEHTLDEADIPAVSLRGTRQSSADSENNTPTLQDIRHVRAVLQDHLTSLDGPRPILLSSADVLADVDPGFFDAFTQKTERND